MLQPDGDPEEPRGQTGRTRGVRLRQADSRNRDASTAIRAIAARGSAARAPRSCSRETATQRTGPSAWMSAMRPAPGSSTSISPISSPTPRMIDGARALDAHRALEHEQELRTRLPDPHDGVAVPRTRAPRRTRGSDRGARAGASRTRADRVPAARSARRGRAAARRPRSARTPPVRGRASGRRPSTSGRREPRGSRELPRRAASSRTSSKRGSRAPSADRPAKWSESSVWLASSTFTPIRVPSWSRFDMRARRSIETSTSGGRSETDMNAFAVIPCTFSPCACRQHRHARRQHAERPSERDRRIALEPASELERPRRLAPRRTTRRTPPARRSRSSIATSNSCGSERSITTDSDDDAELVEAPGYAAGAAVFRCR